MSNPYRAPELGNEDAGPLVWFSKLAIAVWCYPLLLIAILYLTWLSAWFSLGHRPRPSLDDPTEINAGVTAIYTMAGIVLVGFPAAALIGTITQLFFVKSRSWSRRLAASILLIVFWSAVVMFLRWDPFSVMMWYMD